MQQEKKSYAAPELIVYGNIEEITQYVAGSNTDQYGGSAPG